MSDSPSLPNQENIVDETLEIGQTLRRSEFQLIFNLTEIDARFILRRERRDLRRVEIIGFGHDRFTIPCVRHAYSAKPRSTIAGTVTSSPQPCRQR